MKIYPRNMKIKACPFCNHGILTIGHDGPATNQKQKLYVACNHCQAQGPKVTMNPTATIGKIIKKTGWNKRPSKRKTA